MEKIRDIKKIKEEILKSVNDMGIRIKNIILFGSRAKGIFKTDSDWDFLIILEKNVSREEKIEIAHIIRKKLAELYVPCDVLIKSEEEVEARKNIIGSVIKSAMKEGIPL
jgi:predicted nucleotidyltransferase